MINDEDGWRVLVLKTVPTVAIVKHATSHRSKHGSPGLWSEQSSVLFSILLFDIDVLIESWYARVFSFVFARKKYTSAYSAHPNFPFSERFSHFLQKIMKILLKFLRFSQKSPEFSENFSKFTKFWLFFKYFQEKSVNSCRFWKMLKNAPFLITIGVDTAENEPRKGWWVVARTGVSMLARLPVGAKGRLEPGTRAGMRSRSETGSFSAVSAPIVMRNGAFFSIFQNLQEFNRILKRESFWNLKKS